MGGPRPKRKKNRREAESGEKKEKVTREECRKIGEKPKFLCKI
jgi:hypothetical protein